VNDLLETLASVVMAVGLGFASALIPVVNAEAAVTGAGLTLPIGLALATSVAMAVGQTAGKVVLFEAARRGAKLRAGKKKPDKKPPPAWQQRLLASLDGRWQANSVVLLSAGVGLPPLAIVSIAAGAVQSRRVDFIICCLIGRTARFLALVSALMIAW
jgi:membrane protein YqaA with SNARE-associated domain